MLDTALSELPCGPYLTLPELHECLSALAQQRTQQKNSSTLDLDAFPDEMAELISWMAEQGQSEVHCAETVMLQEHKQLYQRAQRLEQALLNIRALNAAVPDRATQHLYSVMAYAALYEYFLAHPSYGADQAARQLGLAPYEVAAYTEQAIDTGVMQATFHDPPGRRASHKRVTLNRKGKSELLRLCSPPVTPAKLPLKADYHRADAAQLRAYAASLTQLFEQTAAAHLELSRTPWLLVLHDYQCREWTADPIGYLFTPPAQTLWENQPA